MNWIRSNGKLDALTKRRMIDEATSALHLRTKWLYALETAQAYDVEVWRIKTRRPWRFGSSVAEWEKQERREQVEWEEAAHFGRKVKMAEKEIAKAWRLHLQIKRTINEKGFV